MMVRSLDCLFDELDEIIVSVPRLMTLSNTDRPYEASLFVVDHTTLIQFIWGGYLPNSIEGPQE